MCSPFPRVLPWVGLCYGSQPMLWHPFGQLSSETGVQQGVHFPFFFSLVLHNLVLSIAQDKDCLSLLFNRWYLDDGVLSGHTHRLLPGQRLSFKRWVHRWGCLSTFLNVSCLDMVTCPPSLLRWKSHEYLTSTAGKLAAFDLTIISPLNPTTLNELGSCSGCWGEKA